MDIQTLQNTLIDNSENLKLADFLNKLINLPTIHEISIATGYWDIKGTALLTNALKDFLARENTRLRILIGKDPNLCKTDLTHDSYKNAKKYPHDYIKIDLQNVELENKFYQEACELLIKYCAPLSFEPTEQTPKITVKIFDTNEDDEKQFFHSKCYIFDGKENGVGYGIIGSSNFTQKGLQGNSELNYLQTGVHEVLSVDKIPCQKSHLLWFNEKWDLAQDWTKEFLITLQTSPLGKKATQETENPQDYTILTVEETYKKFLIDRFDEIISGDGVISADDYMPHDTNFMRLAYQVEAVNQAFPIMRRHNGVIIADVVGLGKTFTALMIIKRHLLETGFNRPVLIITPPAIKQNWLDSIEYFDKDEVQEKQLRPHITITTIGKLENELQEEADTADDDTAEFDESFTQNNFGMIVVDESHNFRNNTTQRYNKLNDLIGEIVPKPKVVLLSATPQNNAPHDLYNQICLFQREKKNSTLSLGDYGNDLESYFAQKQRNYLQYIKKDRIDDFGNKIPLTPQESEANRKNLKNDSEDIRKKIVEPLVIRRTRKDIEASFKDDKKNQHLVFPIVQPPVGIGYTMQGDLAKLFYETILTIAPKSLTVELQTKEIGRDALGYFRYTAIKYLKRQEDQKRYEDRSATVEATSERLEKLMEVLLVKRLESSQAAFKESLHNLQQYTQNMIDMWDLNRIFICPDLDVNKELNEAAQETCGGFTCCLDNIAKKAKRANKKNSGNENEGRNKEYKREDFKEEYFELLQNDLRIINELCDAWDKHTNDPKMNVFLKKFESEFFNKEKNPTRKLIIFTECIATQYALKEKLDEDPSYKVLLITAKNRKEMQEVIAANFDANYKGEQKDDYQILLTTDVLAEGVNLHRANSILNYDSPWNATRLMQRLGRINRIGSKADKIWNYNFYPSAQGDEQINLKNRTYVKLQSFHELFGEDSQIFSKEEEVIQHDPVIRQPDDEPISPITPFIAELKDLKENHFDEYTRLKNITECAVAFTTGDISFASVHERGVHERGVHEKNNTNDVANSVLYIAQKKADGINVLRTSQIDFFERMKEMLKQVQHDKNFQGGHDKVAQLQQAIFDKIATDTANDMLEIKSKVRTNTKEQNAAIAFMQQLLRQKGISKEVASALNSVSNMVRHKNHTVIKKVLELQSKCDQNGLFEDYEIEIMQIARLKAPVNKNKEYSLAIAMLGA